MKKSFYVKLELDCIIQAENRNVVRELLTSTFTTMEKENSGMSEIHPYKMIEMHELGTMDDE